MPDKDKPPLNLPNDDAVSILQTPFHRIPRIKLEICGLVIVCNVSRVSRCENVLAASMIVAKTCVTLNWLFPVFNVQMLTSRNNINKTDLSVNFWSTTIRDFLSDARRSYSGGSEWQSAALTPLAWPVVLVLPVHTGRPGRSLIDLRCTVYANTHSSISSPSLVLHLLSFSSSSLIQLDLSIHTDYIGFIYRYNTHSQSPSWTQCIA